MSWKYELSPVLSYYWLFRESCHTLGTRVIWNNAHFLFRNIMNPVSNTKVVDWSIRILCETFIDWCVYMFLYVAVFVFAVCVCMYMYEYTCICVYAYVHVLCLYVYIHVCVCCMVCIHVCVYAHVCGGRGHPWVSFSETPYLILRDSVLSLAWSSLWPRLAGEWDRECFSHLPSTGITSAHHQPASFLWVQGP